MSFTELAPIAFFVFGFYCAYLLRHTFAPPPVQSWRAEALPDRTERRGPSAPVPPLPRVEDGRVPSVGPASPAPETHRGQSEVFTRVALRPAATCRICGRSVDGAHHHHE